MPRVTKGPQERKNEIVDAAHALFNEKGYEQTSVSDIVKKVGVAQGLFYYYFTSKEEVLNEIVERYSTLFLKNVEEIAANTKQSPGERLQAVFEAAKATVAEAGNLTEYVHRETNKSIHQKYATKLIRQIIPPISEMIAQGVKEGSFDTPYPREAAALLLVGIEYLHDALDIAEMDAAAACRLGEAIGDAIERVLGAKKGSLHLVGKDEVEKYGGWFAL